MPPAICSPLRVSGVIGGYARGRGSLSSNPGWTPIEAVLEAGSSAFGRVRVVGCQSGCRPNASAVRVAGLECDLFLASRPRVAAVKVPHLVRLP